ncbi:acyl-CoA thioester hydrolase/BAAT C-terminal domain-containing protein [Marivirga harenae]|uniref:acyl-CoA thioester hydrolase/BAAT C-terminal domain-containing protein n=1 Tax=Marivirga harenae TaxID=2010992 RepID=UPI0026E056AA|nr:acyl-CoA thioester hydrolase/BAAT C-terminal domain-containing protein [Marivirga harenae]WKV11439.1 acyl-CoA thioester hydrolase/BAAT C-terminal domain-containing protein [Marivirga harenae]
MKKRSMKILLIIGLIIAAGLIYIFTYVPPLSEQHGKVATKLYLGPGDQQALIVAFGGGGGGNDWARDYMKEKRDSLNDMGYAVLALAYFNFGDIPTYLDRISLNAISDSILSVAKHPKIDENKIALMGGSRGGELALNLASRFKHFQAVIALSTSNVSFPAITWSANTSSWTYNGEEVAYVPATFSTISPALKGDLYTAHSMMLEDEEAVKKAEIKVENINGPILIMSGKKDNSWPATEMSNQLMERLKERGFGFHSQHVVLEGGHIAPLDHFNVVYDFLEEHFAAN